MSPGWKLARPCCLHPCGTFSFARFSWVRRARTMENEREQPKRMIGKTQMRTMTSDRVRPALGQGKVVTVHVRTKGTARRHPSHKRKKCHSGAPSIHFFSLRCTKKCADYHFLFQVRVFFLAALFLPLGRVSLFPGACVARELCDRVCGVLWLSLTALSLFFAKKEKKDKTMQSSSSSSSKSLF